MAEEYKVVSLENLLLDKKNPRFAVEKEDQALAVRGLMETQKGKILTLAGDIQKFGLNPSESFIVVPDDENGNYIVLEGNRRLCALRILEDPDIALDLCSPKERELVLQLSAAYQIRPVESANCLIYENREAARHWIEVRHGGEQGGAGIVKWGAAEKSRFRERSSKKEVHMQVLDLLVAKGLVTPQEQQKVPVSSLRRIVELRYARDRLGYDFYDGMIAPDEFSPLTLEVFRAIVAELVSGKTVTGHIYTKEQRAEYIDRIINQVIPISQALPTDTFEGHTQNLPAPSGGNTFVPQEAVPHWIFPNPEQTQSVADISTPPAPSSPAEPAAPATPTPKTEPLSRAAARDSNRTVLPGKGVRLSISNKRIYEIFSELKRLELDEFPNAIAVLFRVFVELSVDVYILKNKTDLTRDPADVNYRLHLKLTDVCEHLRNLKKISEFEAKAVRKAAAADSYLAPSITTMNLYVHNFTVKPTTADLKAAWDNLEPFIVAIWS